MLISQGGVSFIARMTSLILMEAVESMRLLVVQKRRMTQLVLYPFSYFISLLTF